MRKRGIGKIRVSTEDQAENNTSLDHQRKEIEKYAAKNDIELVAIFSDDCSGSILNRPGLNQARAFLKAGKAEVIICLDSDRLTREPAHYMLLRDEFKDLGVELHYTTRGKVNLNDFGQMLVEDFYGRFAHEWKRKLVENTTNGRRSKAKGGNYINHAHPPYGYKAGMIDGRAALLVDDEEEKIVRLIYDLYVIKDMGYLAIANFLTNAKVPTRADMLGVNLLKKRGRGEWSIATVSHIIRGEVYKGKWHYSKASSNPIEVNVPAIVDPQIWEEAQVKRTANKGGRLAAKYNYLLSGRGKCIHCKSPITGQSCNWKSKNAQGLILYYRCNSALAAAARVGVKCDTPNFRADQVDTAVWEWLRNYCLIRLR